MTEIPDIQPVLGLQQLLLNFRGVERQCYVPGADERENDAEHSYYLAVIAWQLAEKIDSTLDVEKILRYALVHDLVEVYAGDTYAFGPGSDTKHAREAEALERIKTEQSEFPSLGETMEGYELRQDRESLFVYAVDKMMPSFLEALNEGRGWREDNITYQQVHEYDSPKVAVSAEAIPYFEALQEYLLQHPEFFAPE